MQRFATFSPAFVGLCLDIFGDAGGSRDRRAVGPETVDVKADRCADFRFHIGDCRPRGADFKMHAGFFSAAPG